MTNRRAQLTHAFEFLGRHLVESPGAASSEVRAAAVAGGGAGALGAFATKVRESAYKVTSEEVDALRRSHPDDALFEVTVCAAYGAAKARHERALAVIDAAWEDA
jgi:hypothetical protein